MAAAATTAPTPLDDSLAKFLGGEGAAQLSPDQVTYGGDIGYDPNTQFRPQGDILTINAEPGTGATTAETWAHELDIEKQKQDALEFEFQQQQEASRLAEEAAQLEMSRASAAQQAALAPSQLQSSQYGATTAGYGAQAAAYSPEAARLSNEKAAYENMDLARKEQDYQNVQAAIQYNAAQNAWLGGAALSPATQAAWYSPTRGATYQTTPGNYGQTNYKPYQPYAQSYGSGIGLSTGI